MKKFFSTILVLALVLNVFIVKPFKVYAEPVDGYETVAENSNFVMMFNKDTTDIMIENKATGARWTTYPADWEKDPLAKGLTRGNMGSHLSIDILDAKAEEAVINSYTMSVKGKDFKYNKINNGIRIDYNFDDYKIKISVEFTLTDFGMSARIPQDSISDTDVARIENISLLPFFGAAKKGDDGYIFIPDGSGAIIDFNANYGNFREISRPVYGIDYSKEASESAALEEGFKLPVFGIKKGDNAFLAVITGADMMSNVTAGVDGNRYRAFRAYTTFTYRDLNRLSLAQGWNRTYYKKLSPNPITTDMVVDYHLLNGDKANYSGMAEEYRNYLIENGDLKKSADNNVKFDLTLIGGIKMKKLFLGLPVTANKALTTFEQAETILNELSKKGIENVNVRYLGYNGGGFMSKWTRKIAPALVLGGSKALKNLIEFTKSRNTNLFLSGELMQVYDTGKGFSSSNDSTRSMGNAVAFQYEYRTTTLKVMKDQKHWYLLAPKKILDAVKAFTSSTKKYDLENTALEDIGQMVYSDYNKKSVIYRDKVSGIITDSMKVLSDGMKNVMVTGGNAYTLPYVTNITDIPMEYSNYVAETESIPFYQMVIHGYISYSGEAFNYSENRQDDFLKMMEYGAVPHYIGIYKESSAIKDSTDLDDYFSPNYKEWIDEAAENYKTLKDVYSGINDKVIVKHEKLDAGVYKTTYENGTAIIVNYNDSRYTNGSVAVDGKNFAVVKGGQ